MLKAVVLLSGGVDSSVSLAIAKERGFKTFALSIDYGQRHRHELKCAAVIAKQLQAEQHRIIRCELGAWGGSALTDHSLTMNNQPCENINTYVPARNIIFLSLALSWAEAIGAKDIFFAANAEDYENYPDCRPEFFNAFLRAAALATRAGSQENSAWQIHTPLLNFSKSQIIQMAKRLCVDLTQTFSCYDPIDQTKPCHQCLACRILEKAYLYPDIQRNPGKSGT